MTIQETQACLRALEDFDKADAYFERFGEDVESPVSERMKKTKHSAEEMRPLILEALLHVFEPDYILPLDVARFIR